MNDQQLTMLAAVAGAIAITTTMDASGHTLFSALPLIALLTGFAIYSKIGWRELGLAPGHKTLYAAVLLIPLLAVAGISATALLMGATHHTGADRADITTNIAIMFSTGILMIAITEEGFFRGLLWAYLQRAGMTPTQILVATTGAFVAWHLSPILLPTEFAPATLQLPIYLVNAILLGLIWGLVRMISDSLWPAAIYHSLWNALVYELYGYGEFTGALGIETTWLFGPERGLAGILVNLLCVAWLWRRSAEIRRVSNTRA